MLPCYATVYSVTTAHVSKPNSCGKARQKDCPLTRWTEILFVITAEAVLPWIEDCSGQPWDLPHKCAPSLIHVALEAATLFSTALTAILDASNPILILMLRLHNV